ncbi:MAG TPA: thioredoxin domain-containing protein [Candidatus Binataceae bacterium]|nr:thioredoxin domain-containing protein [Candidatus Binataceae bacterium]
MRTHFSPKLVLPVSERDHISGPANAPVTMVEYGDYQCPYCGLANPIVDKIRRELGDRLRFVFRNFPLTEVHPYAEHAAEIAEAAGAHNKFWEMHDMLYAHQDALDDRHLTEYATSLSVPASEVKRALTQHVYADRVREDFMSGVRSGVNGTPTFFINGVRHDGSYERESLLAAIADAAR